jgi:hypothetical protein
VSRAEDIVRWNRETAEEKYIYYSANWFRNFNDLNDSVFSDCWNDKGKRCLEFDLKKRCADYCYCLTERFLREFKNMKEYAEMDEGVKKNKMRLQAQNCNAKIFGRNIYNDFRDGNEN